MKTFIALLVCLFTLQSLAKADDDKPISVNELPKKSLEFIKQYFPKEEISYAKVEKDFWDKTYEIVFVKGQKIEFGKNGEWKDIDCKFSVVPASLIPQAIKDYLSKHFPDAQVLQLERDAKKYEVKLNNKLELKFDLKFRLMEIDD